MCELAMQSKPASLVSQDVVFEAPCICRICVGSAAADASASHLLHSPHPYVMGQLVSIDVQIEPVATSSCVYTYGVQVLACGWGGW